VAVTGVEVDGDTWWHLLDDPAAMVDGPVSVVVDARHRHRVAALHTTSHVLNAFVFEEFAGSLVTGAQINGDGTGRMDFDLSAIDNDRLRALAAPVNEAIARDLDVRSVYVAATEADGTPGLVRSLSVAPPPTPDGRLRLIDVEGLDRQACGGTHLTNTGQSPPFRITKIENKGKRNRRIRFALAEPD
jgi:misacylated tRNA(Ala) deacylase